MDETISKINEQMEPDVEPAYTLRPLISRDIFPMVKIVSKIGINEFTKAFESDEVKQLITAFTSEEGGQDTDKLTIVGIRTALEVANTVLSHIGSCEDEIYTFLSGLSGLSESDLMDLPINTFLEMIVDVFKKGGFKDFIGVVSKFVK